MPFPALSLGLNIPFPQVENTVFRIDKHFLTRQSKYFKSELIPNSLPRDRDLPGSSETNPYVLGEVTSEDFASLLWVFYNPCATIQSRTVYLVD